MLNQPLLRKEFRKSRTILGFLALVLIMYNVIIVSLFHPELSNILEEFSKTMPEVMALFGMQDTSASLVGFLASYFFGFIALVFPMIGSFYLIQKLYTSYVEQGSLSYLLASPLSRKTILTTQLCYLFLALIFLVVVMFLSSFVSSVVLFPGQLQVVPLLIISLNLLCLQLFIALVGFAIRIYFKDTKKGNTYGYAIPLIWYVLHMVANLGGDVEITKYVTPFSLFNPSSIVSNPSSAIPSICVLLIFIGLMLYVCITQYRKKDFSI